MRVCASTRARARVCVCGGGGYTVYMCTYTYAYTQLKKHYVIAYLSCMRSTFTELLCVNLDETFIDTIFSKHK